MGIAENTHEDGPADRAADADDELGGFLRRHRSAILEAWADQARTTPPMSELSHERLIDALPQLLDAVALLIDELAAGRDDPELPHRTAAQHALDRLREGFDVATVVSELAMLRETVFDMWPRPYAPRAHRMLDQAIDRAIVASVAEFVETRDRILTALDAVSHTALRSPDLDSLLQALVEVVAEQTPAIDSAVILLCEGDHLRVRATVGLDEDRRGRFTIPIGQGFAGTIAADRAPLEIEDAAHHPMVVSDAIRRRGLHALYGVPLVDGDEVLGVAHIGSCAAHAFSEGDRVLLASMASRVTAGIRHHLLREMAEARTRELEESERRFRATFENAAVGIVHVDREGRFLRLNRRYAELLGYTPEELLGQRWQDCTHPDDRDANRSGVDAVFAGEAEQYRAEKRYVRKDGDTVWAEVTLSVVSEAPDQAAYGVAVVQSIDKRKREEEARERSEATAQLAADVAELGTWDWDLVHDELHWSDQMKRLYGVPLDRPVDRAAFTERLSAEERGPTEAALRHALDPASGGFFQREQRVVRGTDGQPRSIAVRAQTFFDGSGRPLRMIGTARDVTEERRSAQRVRFLVDASAALSESATDYAAAIQRIARAAVPQIADWCLIDPHERPETPLAITHVDAMKGALLARMHRRYPGRMAAARTGARRLGRSTLVAATEERTFLEIAEEDEHLEMLHELGIGSYVTARLTLGDRELGTVSFGDGESGRRFTDSDAFFLEELAGRIAAAVENARLHEETRRSVEGRERILGIVSHDLRNPLGVIDMGSQLLLESPTITADSGAREHVERIARSAQRMSRLIRDLLDMSSIQAGKLSFERAPCPLRPILKEAVEAHRPVAKERGVTLDCEIDDAAVDLVADRDRLLQVLGNLLGNAIKYSEPDEQVLLRGEARGEEVQIIVRDRGPGIAAEDLEKVFDPYWHKDKGGTGLGLFISKGIVEAHGGRIGVESEPGEGATFWITLPRGDRR